MSPSSLIMINPWIHDFAAYDFWSKPLGLLYLAGYLRHYGFNIHLIDCLDRHHPRMIEEKSMKPPVKRSYGTGKFWRQKIPTPQPIADIKIKRIYSRYGLSKKVFEEELNAVQKPAAILVTSLMTYWYPGVMEVINLSRKIHPDVPIILGGIYATLCHEHAQQKSGADHVINDKNPAAVLRTLNNYGINAPANPSMSPGVMPYPAFDLLHSTDYICLLTSIGCPYRCQYCASHFLNPVAQKRNPHEILEEVLFWHRELGVQDFVFYDDALLVSSDTHFSIFLENLIKVGKELRFHTPNALHIREITKDIATLMYRTGFKTIRLGLETSDIDAHRILDGKLSPGEFEAAVHNLLEAGFNSKEIGAYIMIGLPGQPIDSVHKTIDLAADVGASPFLVEYSPIPHTSLWAKAVEYSNYDLAGEPLFHNNTLLPCWDDSQKKEIPILKKHALEVRERYR